MSMKHVSKGVGKEGAGGTEAPQILSSCYYVHKQLLQKNVQSLENKTGKNSFQVISMQCYIYKNQSLEVSKYMILLSLHAKKLDPSG